MCLGIPLVWLVCMRISCRTTAVVDAAAAAVYSAVDMAAVVGPAVDIVALGVSSV